MLSIFYFVLVLVFNKNKTKYLNSDFVTKSYTNTKKRHSSFLNKNLPELLKKNMEKSKRVKYSLHSNLSCINGKHINLCKENIIGSNKIVNKGGYLILFSL